MNFNDLVFTNNLPKIDLHGYDRDTARVAINDFVNENFKLKNKYIVIIHGIGSGILLNTTREALKQNRKVLEYKLDNFNSGVTIVKLKEN